MLSGLTLFMLILLFIGVSSAPYFTTNPTYTTNNFFKSGNYRLISTYTNVSSGSWFGSYPFTFSSAFSAVPGLAYGIKAYAAGDMLQHEHAYVSTISLNTTKFVVNVTLTSPLRMWYFAVAYLAIDHDFPHHFNSFDSVPINYPNLPLVHISYSYTIINVNSSAVNKTYTNVINYTAQAAGRPYTTFTNTLSAYRIVFFLTTFNTQMYGPNTQLIPNLWFTITAQVLNSSSYSISLSTTGPMMMYAASFSLLIYDYDAIIASNKYYVHYEMVTFNIVSADQYYPLEYAFLDNFIMALTQFTAPSNLCALASIWYFYSNATFNGFVVKKAVVVNSTITSCPTNTTTLSIVYLKTWLCPANYYYFNLTSNLCQSNCSYYYYANSTDFVCYPCAPNCLECLTELATDCTNCDSSLFLTLVNGSCVCDSNHTTAANGSCLDCIFGCANCTSSICSYCKSGYVLINATCYICPNNCYYCVDSTNCTQCAIGYYVYLSGQCAQCGLYCSNCTDSTICIDCLPTFELNITDCICNSSNNLYLNSITNKCYLCSSFVPSCLYCVVSISGRIICNLCNVGMYPSSDQLSCLSCTYGCIFCTSLAACSACMTGYLPSGALCVCDSVNNYFMGDISGSCEKCALVGCLTCFNLVTCTTCDLANNYFPSTGVLTTNLCIKCTLIGCLTCSSLTTCSLCDSNIGYGSDPSNIIQCLPCNQSCTCGGWYPPIQNGICTRSLFCGDGWVGWNYQCDDGNNIDYDGCSANCTIEEYYDCNGEPSVCLYNCTFEISLKNVFKDVTACNRIYVVFVIEPQLIGLSSYNLTNMLVSSSALTLVSWEFSKGEVTYTFAYYTTLEGSTLTFNFDPSLLTSSASQLQKVSISLPAHADNNLPLVYCSAGICSSIHHTSNLLYVVEYTSFAILILSAIPAKIVGLYLFGVLQLAYFTLADVNDVNMLLSPLMGMKALNGLNINMNSTGTGAVPQRVQAIGYSSNFISNCNIMLLVLIIEGAIGVGLYIVVRLAKNASITLYRIASKLLKEVLLTLVLFNCFNLAFSAGLHFVYAEKDDPLYVIGCVAAVFSLVLMMAMGLGLLAAYADGFGYFRNKLKPGFVYQSYFVVTIAYRIILGAYTAAMNESQQSSLIVIGVSLLFLVYNLVNLPFEKAYHNYRANICHFTQFVTLFIAMYYRSMRSNSPPSSVALVFTPAQLEIVCIVLSLVVSMVVLGYEIYLFVKEFIGEHFKVKKHSPRNGLINYSLSMHPEMVPQSEGGMENVGEDTHSI